jgi:hypothetical protein
MTDAPELIQEVDTLKLVYGIERKNKKMQAILLQKLELLIDKNSPEYDEYRRVILDESNNYARAIVRLIFGDIDVLIK